MERGAREERQYRPRARVNSEGEEYVRKNNKKKRESPQPHSKQKVSTGSIPGTLGAGQTNAGYHRQRDVPPRFQTHNKTNKQHKYSSARTSATAGGKKQASKDPATNRWQQSSPPSSMQQAHRPPHLTTTLHSQPPHLHHSTQQRGSDDDGGWSRGSPAKGSGWSSKHKTHSMPARDTTKAGNQAVDWGGSPEMDSVAVWPVSEHKHQESGGSGEGDGWNTFSPGQSNCSRGHSQPENWMSDEGSLSMGDNACSPQKDPSPSPSSNTGWNVVPDVPNVQQELEPIEDDEIDEDTPDSSVDDRALQHYHNKDHDGARKSEERSRPSWDNLDSIQPITKADKEVLQFTKESSASSFSDDNQRRSSSSPGSKNTSCSPSGDLDKAVEGETSGIESDRNTFSDGRENSKESTSENASQSRDLGSGGTPDGGGLGMGVWKSHTGVGGSTSSINSIGSSSSWKSDGKNGYHSKPNFSPRKTTRYDSQSSTVSNGSGVKVHPRKMKKPSTGLDDALESLQSEPSGWGDLPSPKPSDADNGTEIWGVAPDDMHRKPKSSNGWGDGGSSGMGKMGGGMMNRGSGEWGEDGTGTMAAGWPGVGDGRGRTASRVSTPGTPGAQWISPSKDGWGKKNRQHNFQDNVSKLMDMGFSHQMAEKYLKADGNDLKAAVSDLLAVTDDSSLERMVGGSNGSRTSKKQPGKNLSGVNHLFGGASNSFSGMSTPPGSAPNSHKDLYHQQLMQNPLAQSHPPLPTSATRMQLLQMQQQYMQMPSATVLGYQQMLTQQLAQLKGAKQQVMQQLQQLRQVNAVSMQGSGSSAQMQLQTRLNLINQFISHINQQLMLQKFPSQQSKDKPAVVDGMKSVTPGSVGSHPLGRNTPPSRNKDMKMAGPLSSRSISLPGGTHEHSLALGMQGMSVNGHITPSSISQSSARSVSRLQQIISGSSEDNAHTSANDNAKFHIPPQSANMSAEMYSSTSPPLSSGICTTTTTSTSTPFSPARSFTDIQEFRPGVPWQPRTLPTEPAQLYAKPGTTQHPELRTVQIEPSFSHLVGIPPGVGLGQQRRPPSLGYNPPGMCMGGGFQGHSTPSEPPHNHPGWQSAHGSTSSPMANSPFSVAGTPDSTFSSFGKRSRPQNELQPPHSTHSLPFNSSGEMGQPPSRPNALFPNTNTFPQAPGPPSSLSSASSDVGGRWGSSQHTYPTSNSSSSGSSRPPISLSSGSVWDSGAAGSNPSSWSSISLDNKSNGSIVTPSSATEPAVPRFTSPPNTSTDTMTPGLSKAWEKGGLQSPSHKSPEPTFAEWQAGKKAHLSVFKLPSYPPSPWLCIHNINTQVDEASLRDVCSEFGILQSVVLAPDTDSAFVQYASKEQAMQAKSGLDKSPVICGVDVAVDFVPEEKLSIILPTQQQQQSRMTGIRSPRHQQSSRDNWSNPNPRPPASGGVHNGSHWDNLRQFPHPPTSTSNKGGGDKGTTANAFWSDSTFLSGLSSPWSTQPQPESALFPSSTTPGNQEPPVMSSSPSLSNYLPNGLF